MTTTIMRPNAAARPTTSAAPTAANGDRWRRRLTIALGAAWLLDAALQCQPYMFSTAFPAHVLAPGAAANPAWAAGPANWATSLFAAHVHLANATAAMLQLLIAVALFTKRATRLGLVATILWALAIWWLGEGMGGILLGPASPLMGFPGAALLYVIIAILLWPPQRRRQGRSVAGTGPHPAIAQTIAVLTWGGFAVETLLPANRHTTGTMIAGMADGEPTPIAAADRWSAEHIGSHGTLVAVLLAATFVLAAITPFLPARPARTATLLVITAAAFIWVVGQNLGSIATGNATDLNTGPLLILLSLCYWPYPPVVRDGPKHRQTVGWAWQPRLVGVRMNVNIVEPTRRSRPR